MKKKKASLLLCVALLLTSLRVGAQTDSLRQAILKYRDTKRELISKGRNMLLDKFLEGDKAQVRTLVDYLSGIEDNDYQALYPSEAWLLDYWCGSYEQLLAGVRQIDSAVRQPVRRSKISPEPDVLLQKVKERLRPQKAQMNTELASSALSPSDKAFLSMNLEYLLADRSDLADPKYQDLLNALTDDFLKKYPASPYEQYVRSYIRRKYRPARIGLAFEFFSGYGIFTSGLQEHFSNNVPLGVDFDICYRQFILFLRDYIGINKTKDSMSFGQYVWAKDAQSRVYLPEASIGYIVLDNKRWKMAPFAGISSMSVSPTSADQQEDKDLKNVGLNFTTTYTAGFNIDFKLGKSKRPIVAQNEDGYWFIRLRYAYNQPQFDKKYSGFDGAFHYFTIGIGGFGRKIVRDY